MGDENKSYYAIIPANVRYDTNLKDKAKLLYGEITALCNEKGYCWATNDYFASLYGVSKTTISLLIKNLIESGYINSQIIYKEGTKEILNRYLSIVTDPIKENLNTPIKEKLKDNNTSINNTINNTYNKRFSKPTIEQVKEYCLERKNNVNPEQFIDYYEANGWKVGKNPMKDWKASIRTWERRENTSNNKKPIRKEIVPDWMNEKIEKEEMTPEELAELEKELEVFKQKDEEKKEKGKKLIETDRVQELIRTLKK